MSDPIIAKTPPSDALPDDYDPFEHLQAVYIPQHNAVVQQYFSDLGNDWKPNIATTRSSLRVACTMVDNDNQLMMNLRHHLLFDLLGYGKSGLITYHGSTNDIAPPVDGHPKVCFYFSQDRASVPTGYSPVDAEYSFRLINETAATFTKSDAIALANKIKPLFFTAGKGLKLTKGKNIYVYKDEMHGYRLRIYCSTDADAVDLVQKLLEARDVVFDENKLSISTPKRSNTAVPSEAIVYGKETKLQRYRPAADTYLRYVYVSIPNVKKNIFLLDSTGRYNALVSVH
ncbi:hypothetical protein [Nostoc sp.]|uniref:hypothetical protein n=1 Tax=Nostoc sp. TaxID=1180 RepID=UPI002FFB6818